MLGVFFVSLPGCIPFTMDAFLCKPADGMFLYISEFILQLPLWVTSLIKKAAMQTQAMSLPPPFLRDYMFWIISRCSTLSSFHHLQIHLHIFVKNLTWPPDSYCCWVVCFLWYGLYKSGLRYFHPWNVEAFGNVTDSCFGFFFTAHTRFLSSTAVDFPGQPVQCLAVSRPVVSVFSGHSKYL